MPLPKSFSIIYVSDTFTPIGSVATSLVPIRVNTLSTSGCDKIMDSALCCKSTLIERDTSCGLIIWKAIAPSCNCGRNSAPIFLNIITLKIIVAIENDIAIIDLRITLPINIW